MNHAYCKENVSKAGASESLPHSCLGMLHLALDVLTFTILHSQLLANLALARANHHALQQLHNMLSTSLASGVQMYF